MITTYDIAKKAGVSQATVSRVLNGNPSVSPETRQKVMELVRKFDYQPNHAAQSLSKKQSFLLGMIVPDVANPFFSEVLKAVEQAADMNGYNLVLCDSRNNLQKEKQCLNVLRRHQVAGILLVPVDKEQSLLHFPKSSQMPVVVITKELDSADCVSVSHSRGGAMVANHFLELGHTKLAFLGFVTDEKLHGFREVLQSRGIPLHEDNIIALESFLGQQGFNDVHKNVTAYLQKKNPLDVTALFAYNDLSAFAAISILQEHGYRVPDDIAVVGFDNTFLANEMKPRLTSVAQPISEIARTAVDVLLQRISGEHTDQQSRIVLEPTLIIRESTRKTVVPEELPL